MRRHFPTLLLSVALLPAAVAQQLTILLDPARGGSEYGAHIDEHTYEKQVTLEIADRLRSLLNARDFNVVLTRDSDVAVTSEARAAAANTSRPVACLLVHSSGSGSGVHLFTTSLDQAPPAATAILWDAAQSPYVDRSQRLSSELATAFSRSRIPVFSGRTWIRPLDNMQCPAVAIEIGPEKDGTPSSDHAYQNRIANTIAGAMLFWRGHTDLMQSIVAPPPPPPVAPEKKPDDTPVVTRTGTHTAPIGTPALPGEQTTPSASRSAARSTVTPQPGSPATPTHDPRPVPARPAPPRATAPVVPAPQPPASTGVPE